MRRSHDCRPFRPPDWGPPPPHRYHHHHQHQRYRPAQPQFAVILLRAGPNFSTPLATEIEALVAGLPSPPPDNLSVRSSGHHAARLLFRSVPAAAATARELWSLRLEGLHSLTPHLTEPALASHAFPLIAFLFADHASRLLNSDLVSLSAARSAEYTCSCFSDGIACAISGFYAYQQRVIRCIFADEVMILIGETGSGKSTQLVQFLADSGLAANGSIVCTQPRKIAAVSLSHRVDEESNGCYGDNFVLSYPTLLISQDFSSKIIFTTDSCLLHHCMNDMGLDGISYIIVDEAHERSLNTDLLLALIKKNLLDRLDLRLIIMSATADANRLAEYFYGCQTFHVKGRSFPVEIKYVPDISLESSFNTIPNPLRGACATAAYVYDVVRMVNIIHKNEEEGAVLAFLNGLVKTSAIQMLWYFRCMESFPM